MAVKPTLTAQQIDSQTSVELPERETLLVTVVITNLLNGNRDFIHVEDVNVAAEICANVLASQSFVTCEIEQR